MLLICFWKCSGALDIPNGNLLKQNRPAGVMNVVSRRDVGDKEICQNPLFASSLLNSLAPVSWASTLSTLGSGCTSLMTFWLRGFRSTQIRMAPDFLGATTIPAHQGVGESTFEITPMDSIRLSLSSTFCRSGSGTLLGVYRENWLLALT